ncbi:phage tail protein [Hafnia alvei]|uniref:phage tail protein n=1 Tax=Hafnia alvei TaxID=569 RepID=UPI001F228774|nr:phage tail protein [Hafnia alvei]MCE9873617.1 phage tail protein [Hafnia alvei]
MANFYSIITNRGKELETEALASGTKITLVKFVVGDGNGQATPPKPTQTKLVNEKYRGDIGELSVSPDQSTQMMAKVVLPTDVGGFTVREIGILTDAGELYAVANCAAIEKPVGGVSVNMQFRLAVSDTANITLNVATGDGLFLRIDQDLSEIRGRGALAQKAARESLAVVDASTKQKGLVQLNSATNSTSETQAATPAAVKAANDNANGRLEKNKNLSDVPDKSKARANLELIKQTSPTDNTTGSLLTVGAFGLGGNSIPVTTTSNSDLSKMPAIPFNAIREYKASDGSVYLIGISGISPGGNLVEWLAPENGADAKKIAVRNKDSLFVLYSTGNKPTSEDVNAIARDGCRVAGFVNDAKDEPYMRHTSSNAVVRLLALDTANAAFQPKGNYALVGASYTKVESDNRYYTKAVSDAAYAPANWSYSKAASDTRYVQGVQLGAETRMGSGSFISEGVARIAKVPAGCTMTSVGDNNASGNLFLNDIDFVGYKPIQRNINGTWVTISG